MINWLLAILVEKGVMKMDEAKELARLLSTTTYSNEFKDAHKDIKTLLDGIENK